MNSFVVDFDPIMISLGPVAIRWYGVMYVIGFVLGGQIMKRILCRSGFLKITAEEVESLIFYWIVGMFIFARTFYVFIYNWDYYSNNLGKIFAVWEGGLSYHGALFGMITASYVFGKKYKLHLYEVLDTLALAGAQGVFWGRVGNFINGELYGRVTNSWFGMIFPAGGPYPRHASQLYEGLTEGILLMIILWIVKQRTKTYGFICGLYVILYAFFRFNVEFFREADSQIGYYFGNTLTMGQILCILMSLVGVAFIIHSRKLNMPIVYTNSGK